MARSENHSGIDRRGFLAVTTLAGAAKAAAQKIQGNALLPTATLGGLKRDGTDTPIAGATWHIAEKPGDGFSYQFAPGTLAKAQYLAADMILDGNHMIVFQLAFQEGEKGRTFTFRFSGLNQCSFRLRMPLSLVDQNRWGIDREGAFLKPRAGGARVDLAKVDRMRLTVTRKSPKPARWAMTDLVASEGEVARIDKPILPKGPLIDELGQSTLHEWPAKSRGVEEVNTRIRRQLQQAPAQKWPGAFTQWGGWKAKRLGPGSGFFRVLHDGQRWWLVDPQGYAFWSAGLDCVRVDTTAAFDGLETALKWMPDPSGEFRDIYDINPDVRRRAKSVNYLAANFIRAVGREGWREKWARVALAELRRLRFNTVGNWSEWEFARKEQFPYVRPMSFRPTRVVNIYRDFPDVFHPGFEQDAADYASVLQDTASDPAFVGYFLMNEPTWGFSSEVPAAGMLYITETCETRNELARFLKKKYPDDAALSKAWNMEVTFERVATGKWTALLTKEAIKDLEAFSVVMVERYFRVLSSACKAVDKNHLNLGMRWAGLPPQWAVEGMKFFDVFSINCYREKVPAETTRQIHAMLNRPTLIGEWHFGALDVGLPSSGIGHLKNQADRAKAYRVYLEDAAANPHCVGAHWFTLYDQSALGRFDGENYNIGFLDICNRAYEEMGRAATASHERVYDVAAGRVPPFSDAPEHLQTLY
ncbi:MAG: hypothetical protein FJW34_12295 [Acidobacteria bacterium]|nr:hypothetical protein [Acidobacteriota bacterium]